MKIQEITSEKNAIRWLSDAIEASDNTEEADMEFLEANIEKWSNEFDELEREIKHADKVNHYKNNRIIGLYFLIPAAISGVNLYKKFATEKDYA